jgi:sec-independent protein translocase protein TatB
MFDISWTEFLLIGVVALIVIGPKELPAVLRTLGQWTRKVRGMATDFQNQFQEAMREAEMADLKKEVDNIAQDFSHFDPLKDVRDSVESVGKDLEKSIETAPKPAEPVADAGVSVEPALTDEPAAIPATPEPAAIAAAPEPVAIAATPEPAATAAAPASTERTG